MVVLVRNFPSFEHVTEKIFLARMALRGTEIIAVKLKITSGQICCLFLALGGFVGDEFFVFFA